MLFLERKKCNMSKPMTSDGLLGHPFDIFNAVGVAIKKSLKASDYETLQELSEATDEELKGIKGIGARSINPIRGILASVGYDSEDEGEGIKIDTSKIEAVARPINVEGNDGKIRAKINFFDPAGVWYNGEKRKATKNAGDVILGNKNPEDDLHKDYVANLVARGEAE